ncbi:MAG: M50 family metallopeptidase [Candidatus Saccharimonadales bacterium]
MSVFLLILSVVMFIGLVVIHEFGHFVAARRGGVEVEEFGIGFPPRVWSKKVKTKNSKFLFTVNALPLGGFVRLKGESDAATQKGSFGAAPLGTKVKIMLAGVVMNFVAALALFTLLALMGMPKLVDNQFTVASDTKVTREVTVLAAEVDSNQPAGRAGIQNGDQLISIDGTKLTNPTQIGSIARDNAGKTIPFVVRHDGQQREVQVTINAENTGNGFVGVVPGREGIQLQKSTWSAPVVAVGLTKQLTGLTFKGIGTAFSSLFKGDTKTAKEQVAGPVGIAVILNEGSKIGINFVLFIIAILSLSLAIINVLPIPALDGGRLFVLLLFKALKKPLTKSREEAIHGAGFVALMGLFVLITIVDVQRFF